MEENFNNNIQCNNQNINDTNTRKGVYITALVFFIPLVLMFVYETYFFLLEVLPNVLNGDGLVMIVVAILFPLITAGGAFNTLISSICFGIAIKSSDAKISKTSKILLILSIVMFVIMVAYFFGSILLANSLA